MSTYVYKVFLLSLLENLNPLFEILTNFNNLK